MAIAKLNFDPSDCDSDCIEYANTRKFLRHTLDKFERKDSKNDVNGF